MHRSTQCGLLVWQPSYHASRVLHDGVVVDPFAVCSDGQACDFLAAVAPGAAF